MRAQNIKRGAEFWGLAHAIADEFQVKISQITGPTRGNERVCIARDWLCKLARDRGFTCQQIGNYLHRDHTTIVCASQRAGGDFPLVFKSVRGAKPQ